MREFTFRQTAMLRQGKEGLLNELIVSAPAWPEGELALCLDGKEVWRGVPEGESFCCLIPEPERERSALAELTGFEPKRVSIRRPKHWTVHLVEFSHHDPGFTDVPSCVLEHGVDQLRDGLKLLEERENWPEEARPRFVIEQCYSLAWFLRRCSAEERERLIRQVRAGNIEVTALWANLISELLSPAEAIHALDFSAGFSGETGVPIVSAEHNDITGFTWGYSTLLSRAGIKYFLPALPLYYSWGHEGYESFWDVEKIFGADVPGAFWWESPEGERIFFWSGNHGCGDESSPVMKELFPELERLESLGWPHDVLRWEVRASGGDNFGYSPYYSDFVSDWREKYVWPKLICSTNKRFCEDFLNNLKTELPVRRGGVDGQDYPIASTSQMASSARARQLHGLTRTAEILESFAPPEGGSKLPRAAENLLFADEHAYGFTAPASAQQLASWWEHGAWAGRAWADVWRSLDASASALAKRVSGRDGNPTLTIFRTSGDNGPRGVTLNARSFANEYLDGHWHLVDRDTGEETPYLLRKIGWEDAEPAAAARTGVAAGTKKMGLFPPPAGEGYTLSFTAKDLPACGRKTWDLVPADACKSAEEEPAEGSIENEYYRVSFDEGGISGIWDRTDGKELLDVNCGERLGTVYVRYANDAPVPMTVERVFGTRSAVVSRVTVLGRAEGFYSLRLTLTLAAGEDAVRLNVRAVKNKLPLQTAYLAFPFAGTGMRYQSLFHRTAPAADTLPGSQSDVLAVQDWVLTEGSDVLWNAANAPIVSLSHLWPGYISPAHRCIMVGPGHPPLKPEDFDTGHVYSVLCCNNFGTNFFASQLSDVVYEYTFAGRHGRDPDTWGAGAAETVCGCFGRGSGGNAAGSEEFLRVPGLRVLELKRADDGRGHILRVVNDGGETVTADVTWMGKPAKLLALCELPERDVKELRGSELTVRPGRMETVRLADTEV